MANSSTDDMSAWYIQTLLNTDTCLSAQIKIPTPHIPPKMALKIVHVCGRYYNLTDKEVITVNVFRF